MSTMNVPGIGTVKREYVLAGGALAAGIVGYAWWQNRGSGGQDVGQTLVPASEILPVTDYENPQGYGNSSGIFPGNVDPDAITTNAEWTQRTIEYLVSIGYNSVFVSTTLGKFLGRQPLNEIEKDLVRTAIAASGPPPEGGPYPLDLPGTADVAIAAPKNLRVTGVTPDSITLAWDAADNADHYTIDEHSSQGQSAQTTEATTYTKTGLSSDLVHTFAVRTHGSNGQVSAPATITGKTAAAGTGGQAGAAPGNFRATELGDTFVSLAWDAVPGAQSYRVTHWGFTGLWSMSTHTTTGTTDRWTNLKAKHNHKFSVQAITAGKLGPKADATVPTSTANLGAQPWR